jgi:hypothetical protein
MNKGAQNEPTPPFYGKDCVDLINWMQTVNPEERPDMAAVCVRLEEIIHAHI